MLLDLTPATISAKLTQKRLRELLDYDPETGIFTWKQPTSVRVKVGQHAGARTQTKPGKWYVIIGVDGVRYFAHRLAHLYMTGSWPVDVIDHLNGSGDDNRWANLRNASRIVNMQNRQAAQKNSKSGLIGSYPKDGRWVAAIKANGKAIFLGSFATPMEAHVEYLRTKRELHEGCTL